MKAYNDFIELVQEIHNYEIIGRLLGWDQEVLMPPNGIKDRAPLREMISGVVHSKTTSKKMEELLNELNKPEVFESLTAEQKANVRDIKKEFDRSKSIPEEHVKEVSKLSSMAVPEWVKAKEKNDFSIFQPFLEKMVELKKKEAEYIGYKNKPYDALMDQFEPGLTHKEVVPLFADLRTKLVPIVANIIDSGYRPDYDFLVGDYPVEAQRSFNNQLAADLGFDFDGGRLDESAHPFTTGSLRDVRITTRYRDDLRVGIQGTIHETGHALYEMGFLDEHYGTPMAQAASLGIHESQSRWWENLIGRSLPFWTHYFPKMQKAFPGSFDDKGPEDMWRAFNDVSPSFIRVEADEVTYNLHIILRQEIETGLMDGDINVSEAPQVWNEKFDKYLQLEVPDNAQGVLQDIHWAFGYIGYFPTYTLGNLYSVQFFNQAEKDLGGIYDKVENGEFAPILDWLRTNIHHKGRLMPATELVKDITGESLSVDPFIEYLKGKFGPMYGF